MRAILWLFLLGSLVAAGTAAAQAPDDAVAIRALIEQQLDAFQQDDGGKAYGFAAPGIKKVFPNPDDFMRMVREQYAAVYRHKNVLFGDLKDAEAGKIQAVELTDESGDTWLALYSLEKQPDGSWLISGCALIKKKSERA